MKTVATLRGALAGAAIVVVMVGLVPAGASSANISRAYSANGTIRVGSLVAIDSKQQDFVQAANTSNGSRLLGVAVASNDSLLAVNPTVGKVQVATTGNANALVSTLNGDIHVGDQVAVSPFNGIGMRAASGSYVIGLAQTDFNQRTQGGVSEQVSDQAGVKHRISVGFVRISIALGKGGAGSGQQVSSLQRFNQSLTGHTVSTPRILIALVITGIALVVLMTLIYGAIYSTIISIGRNPLAKYAVFKTLGSVLGMVAAVAIISVIAVVLLLY